jgi:hypothetical protein
MLRSIVLGAALLSSSASLVSAQSYETRQQTITELGDTNHSAARAVGETKSEPVSGPGENCVWNYGGCVYFYGAQH